VQYLGCTPACTADMIQCLKNRSRCTSQTGTCRTHNPTCTAAAKLGVNILYVCLHVCAGIIRGTTPTHVFADKVGGLLVVARLGYVLSSTARLRALQAQRKSAPANTLFFFLRKRIATTATWFQTWHGNIRRGKSVAWSRCRRRSRTGWACMSSRTAKHCAVSLPAHVFAKHHHYPTRHCVLRSQSLLAFRVIHAYLPRGIAHCRRNRCRRKHPPCTCQAHNMVCTAHNTPKISQNNMLSSCITFAQANIPEQAVVSGNHFITENHFFTLYIKLSRASTPRLWWRCCRCRVACKSPWGSRRRCTATKRARHVRVCAKEQQQRRRHEMRLCSLQLCTQCPRIRRACIRKKAW
jgi:hypothetical protein